MHLLILFTKYRWEFGDKILGDPKAAAQEGSGASMASVFSKAAQMRPVPSVLPVLCILALPWEQEATCNWAEGMQLV